MVVRSERRADRVFYALSDPTRRDIVRRTGGEGQSVSTLAGHYPMSFAAVQKHVAVLERAGLVTKHTRGRERIVRSNTEAIQHARDLLGQLEEVWRARIDRFEETLHANEEGAQR